MYGYRNCFNKEGHEVKIAYGREHVPTQYRDYAVKIGSRVDVNRHVLQARFLIMLVLEVKRQLENLSLG